MNNDHPTPSNDQHNLSWGLRHHKTIGLGIAIGLMFFGIGTVIVSDGNWFIFTFGVLLQICGIYQINQVRKIWNKKIIGWKKE